MRANRLRGRRRYTQASFFASNHPYSDDTYQESTGASQAELRGAHGSVTRRLWDHPLLRSLGSEEVFAKAVNDEITNCKHRHCLEPRCTAALPTSELPLPRRGGTAPIYGRVGAAEASGICTWPRTAYSTADLTIEHVRALAGRADQVESQTLEFKREYSSGLLKSIAAMADTYGGVILVGVSDAPSTARTGPWASTRTRRP